MTALSSILTKEYNDLAEFTEALGGDAIAVTRLPKEPARDLQDMLKHLGFYKGVIDGLPGRNTANAFAEFKRSANQGSPNLVGAGSISLMFKQLGKKYDTEYPELFDLYENLGSDSINIRKVSREVAREIQKALRSKGFYGGSIDGIIGRNSAAAFAAFKSSVWMGEPELLGASSILALIEEKHKVSEQALGINTNGRLPDAGKKTGRTMRLPNGEIVYANQFILPGGNLTWGEFTKNCTRIPTSNSVCQNAIITAQAFAWVRDKWGSPIGITSAYRPPHINRRVGGARRSQHLYGRALDIYPKRGSVWELWNLCKASPFTGLGAGMRRGFCHVDVRPTLRVIFNY